MAGVNELWSYGYIYDQIVFRGVFFLSCYKLGLPCGSVVKNLPAMRENWFRSLGREDPREEEMATHSSILAWGIPWTEDLSGLQSFGSQRVGCD